MASLTNTKIKNTYVSLLKVADNGQLDAALQDITDGAGNTTGIQLNNAGDVTASGTVAFGSLKDTGENITITKFVDAADGISGNDNDTTIPTTAAIKAYVDSNITAQDLDIAGDSGTGAVDLDSQSFTIAGTTNEVVTAVSGQTVTIGLPSSITVDVTGSLTGNVSGNVTGNLTGNVSGNVSGNVTGDLTGNVTATSVLVDGVTATTQIVSDNSTKVATTAFVKSVVTAENLDIAGTSGTGSVDLDSQTLTIAGTTNEIETSASGQTITVGLPSDVIIGNDLTVTTDASVGNNLDVTGTLGVDGNFDVATNKFTVQSATGNTDVAGTLGVTGNTTLSTVDVTGLASLDGGIDVDGAFTVADSTGNISTSGTLGVTGTSTLGVINASGLASLDGGIDVDGAFTVSDTTGNIQTSGTLGVTGTTSLTDDLAVDTDTLFVDASADRVGINKNNPAVALDVTGDITSSGTVTGTTLTGTLSTAAQTNITSVGTLSSLAVSGNLTVDTNTLFVDAANNFVGIGTTSPATQLNVLKDSADVEIRASSTTSGNVRFGFDASGAVYNWIQTDRASSAMQFAVGNAERMRIDSSGNVGINTDSPSTYIDGSVGLSILQPTDGRSVLSLIGTRSTSDEVLGRLLFTNTNTTNLVKRLVIIDGVRGADDNSGYLVFQTANSGNPAERMRITSGGEVYIAGTTDNGAYNLQCNGTGVWGQGAYVNGSDIRFKEEIKPIESGLDVVEKLKPVSYKYRKEFSRDVTTQAGFIAQDLQEALEGKEYLDGIVKSDSEYLSVAYQSLIPILTKAIQELRAEVESLKSQLNA